MAAPFVQHGPSEWISAHPLGAGLLFAVYFILLWTLVGTIISRTGGWNSLAQQFRLTTTFDGTIFRWQSAQMRWLTNYNGCLAIGADPLGLYLAIIFPFGFAHPPLFIPWREITLTRKKTMLFVRYVGFALGRDLCIPMWIRESLAERIKVAAGSGWPAANFN